MDGVNFASQFEDPAKSKVVGKVGYAVLPSGPGGHFSPIYITGMAVNAQSRNKEASYLFCQWATNKANAVRELMAGRRRGPHVDLGQPGGQGQAQDARRLVRGLSGLAQDRSAGIARDRRASPSTGTSSAWPSRRPSRARRRPRSLAQAQKDFQDMLNRTES